MNPLIDTYLKARGSLQEAKGYEVELKAVPNSDYDGGHEATVRIAARRVPVASPEAASAVVRKFITDNELGGGNFAGGDVYQGGKKVAHVSFNGRLWGPDGREPYKQEAQQEAQEWTL